MKIIFFILFFLTVCIQHIQAQFISSEKRHFIALNLGVANPLGDYGSMSTSNDNSGLAKTGVNFGMEGAYYVKPYFGIGANIGAFINKVNPTAIQESFAEQITPLVYSYSITPGSWKNTYYLLGPTFSLPLKKITLDLKVLGGLMHTASPSLDITMISNNTSPAYTIHEKMDPAKGNSFGYDIGLAMRYEINPKWALRLSADYIAANPNLNESVTAVTSVYGYTVDNTTTGQSSTQKISTLNIGIGVAYQLKK